MQEVDGEIRSGKTVVLDFYAEWCIPCRAVDDVLTQVSRLLRESNRVVFLRVNVDVEKEAAEKFEVYGLPTVIVFHKGVEVKRFSGVPRNFAVELLRLLKSLS